MLRIQGVQHVFKEPASSLFRRRVSSWQLGSWPALSEFHNLRRAEELVRQLERFDAVEIPEIRKKCCLRVIFNRSERLRLKIRLASVQHDDRIDGRRVQRRGYTAKNGHNIRCWRVGDRDVIRELDAHENGRVALDPGRSVDLAIIAAVCTEQRIIWMGLEK